MRRISVNSYSVGWHLHLLVLLCFTAALSGQGIKRPASPPGVVPIFEPTYLGFEKFYLDSTLLKSNFSRFSRQYEIDSTRQYIFISEKLYDFDYRLPIGMQLSYYAAQRIQHDNREKWRETIMRNLGRVGDKGAGGIELNIPVRIRSKAFRRIFGGDRVGLRVTGNISFELAGRSEDRSGSAVSSFEESGNFSPKFKQTQQFRVEGKVGDKVSVSVDQNSEATFDFENTLKLIYDGDEDEIVQKIEAGNVALNLPSTNYVSTSANHQGLFGLKSQMRVGNLSFTGIASLQRGESQKITKTGGASENSFRVKDIDYTNNRFFFVDSVYLENFENFNEQMGWIKTPGTPQITQLDVWKSTTPDDELRRDAWAVTNPQLYTQGDSLPSLPVPGKVESGIFVRLTYGRQYDYNENRGYFWLNEQVSDNDIIAVAYTTENGDTVGDIYASDTTQIDTFLLKLIKPRSSNPGYKSTWKLAMRNVYNLGASQIPAEGFDAKVLFTVTGQDQEVEIQSGRTFNYLMGLDRLNEQGDPVEGGDKKLDRNGWIFDLGNGYMIFPSITPFAPNDTTYFPRSEPSQFDIDREHYVDIYNIKDRTLAQQRSKFEIEITSTSVSSTYELGFNVLEGSEIVRLNGRPLTREKDYTIDYFSGTLQVIAPEARRADAQIDIEYERASLFQLDKKTLLGGRVEYEFGENNFVGFTALYFNQSTLDQRIRVGQEPIRNLVWDVNTALTFKPNFLSTMFDKLPLVETSAESRLKIEAEYAQVNPNPNTFEEPNLGEKGVAYIDDFEGSKRATSLGILYRTWSYASIPQRFKIQERDTVDYTIPRINEDLILKMDANRLRMNWYNPFNQVPIRDIWPDRDVNAQTGTTTNVLNLRWRNDDIHPDSAWAGMMRSTASFPDQKKTKFIEIWIKPRLEGYAEDTRAQVNINIGRISEDFWVRGYNHDGYKSLGNLSTEDINKNGLLDDGEDVGLERDINGNPVIDPNQRWLPPNETNPPFLNINGLIGNSEQKTARYPDTEDLDGDGSVNTFNDYFEYSFDLSDEDHPYIQGKTRRDDGTLTGWRLYRIPIRNFRDDDMIGNPDTSFQEIFFVRLWVNNIPQESQYRGIQIATFDFVGSDWEEQGILYKNAANYILDDSLFSITVYNDEENRVGTASQEGYHSPPGVTGVEDRITKAVSKEQSLVLQLHQLEGDSTVAEARKQLGEKMNLVHYRTLKMFVHGDRDLPMEDSPLEFYIRFGSTADHYYEYGVKVYPHWDNRNEIVLDFNGLTQTRQDQYQVDTTLVFFRRDPQNPEKYFQVVGNPNLRNIQYFIFGARNVSQTTIRDMEIWVDELRVTDVEKEKGAAMRLLTDLTVADIGRLTAQWEVIDDNFRRIEQQFPSIDGKDRTDEKQSYTGNLNLDKFLPDFLGLEVPVSGRYTRTRSVPKYFYNSDRRTHYEFSSFTQRLEAFFGLNELPQELDETSDHNETRAIGATIRRKERPRDAWFLKYTINKVVLDVDYSTRHSRSPTILFNDSEVISGSFRYSLNFGRDNFIKPFSWLGKARILKPLTGQKLYYTPSNANAGFLLSDNESNRQNRLEPEPTQTVSVTSSRQVGTNYKLTDNIDVSLSRNYKSDAYIRGYRAKDVIEKILTEFDFGEDLNVTQRFALDYRPQFFDWMNQSFRYSSDFGYNLSNPRSTRDQKANSKITRQFKFDLKPSVLANKIYSPQKRPSPQRRSASGRPPAQGEDEGGEGAQSDTTKKKDSGIPSIDAINPAKLVWKFFNAWKSINLDYNMQDDYQHPNLADMPQWKYQFGFSTDPGVDTSLAGNKVAQLPAIRNARGVSGGLQFDIIKNLSSNFRYQYDKATTQNNQRRSESINSSFFFSGDDPENNKKSWWGYVPDWTLRLNGVEKFLFFDAFTQTMSLEHSRSGKFSESARLEQERRIRDQWSYANSYQPLLGVNFTTRIGLSGSIRYNSSVNFNYNPTGAVTRSEQSGLNMTASYSVTKGFKIPLPFIKMKSLKNEIQFSLAFDKSSSASFSKSAGDEEFIEREVNKNWKIRPSATYRFSQNVNGTAFFEKGQSENKRTGVYSYFEFGVNVNIAIR